MSQIRITFIVILLSQRTQALNCDKKISFIENTIDHCRKTISHSRFIHLHFSFPTCRIPDVAILSHTSYASQDFPNRTTINQQALKFPPPWLTESSTNLSVGRAALLQLRLRLRWRSGRRQAATSSSRCS